METPKEHTVNNFEDLLNLVTKENVDNLSVDIYQWLRAYVFMIEKVRNDMPDVCDGKNNWDIVSANFKWIDDGKTDFLGFTVGVNGTDQVIDIKSDKK